MGAVRAFSWLGDEQTFLDTPTFQTFDRTTLGCFGGCTSAGAKKNEDAAFILDSDGEDWTFAAVLDAHGSSASARAVIALLTEMQEEIAAWLRLPLDVAFRQLQDGLLERLGSPEFKEKCRHLQGETALLCCATKDNYIWWLSVGDCLAYLIHPELLKLGQAALNQRHFFQ